MKLRFTVIFFISLISFSETTWAMFSPHYMEQLRQKHARYVAQREEEAKNEFWKVQEVNKETPQEYAARKERVAEEKRERRRRKTEETESQLEQLRQQGRDMKVPLASHMSALTLKEIIHSKEAAKAEEDYEAQKKSQLEHLRRQGRDMKISMSSIMDARTLRVEIHSKEVARAQESREARRFERREEERAAAERKEARNREIVQDREVQARRSRKLDSHLRDHAAKHHMSVEDARRSFARYDETDASIPGPCFSGAPTFRILSGYNFPEEWNVS